MNQEIVLENLYAVILAGGSGTRLWPLSRMLQPKQLLHLPGCQEGFCKKPSPGWHSPGMAGGGDAL